VLRIVYALNRVWQPTSKRLADRIEEALNEPDPLRTLLVMGELQADAVALAPRGPNIDRAGRWLSEVVEVLREAAKLSPDR
jgi:hypothetical protein